MKMVKRILLFLVLLELGTIITFTTLTILKRKEIKTVINDYVKAVGINSGKELTYVSDIDIGLDEKPTEGWVKIKDGKAVEYSLKYENYVVDLEKEVITISKDGSVRIIPEIIIKIGEDNIISENDEVILKYGNEEYKFNVTEINEETITMKTKEKINIEDLKNKGFKSIIEEKIDDSGNTLIIIKRGENI